MRKIWDIHGGVHPDENKHQSNQLPISLAGLPAELIFPLSQHIGAPAKPIVEVGQQVLKGEMIAAANGFVSVPVHASSSGEIIAIEQRSIPHPSGMSAPCIVLKPDGRDQWLDHQGLGDYQTLDKKVLLDHIRQSGIAGMGGAGFPSAVKLGGRDDQPIESLIINGTECEPYITADDVLMRERADQIIAGAQILKYLIKPSKETLIGVEDNKPEGIAALQKAAEGSGIEIVSFPTKYPSGGEKQLIQILTGKEVPSGGLPAQVGIVCQNVGTAVAIYRAVALGEPLISRVTTVTGYACKQQQNFDVLLGTPVAHLLALCDYDAAQCSRLIMGGPMMGFTLPSTSVPVVKTTNCILAPTAEELSPPSPAQACIRCGLCAEACPVSLLPQQMYWFARGKEYEKLEAHNLMDCIECGACSYACPSHIPLVQYYRASKAEIRQQKLDAQKAERSKARFEARKERIERQDAEKEAKRKARKEAAEAKAAAGNKTDVVQAAVDRAKAKKSAADPAQAAIDKAMTKRAGGGDEAPSLEKLQQALASVEKRLASARAKLQQAEQDNSENIAAFQTGVAKTEDKYQLAKQALDTYVVSNPAATTVASEPTGASATAAQGAISRALAKREAASKMTDEERLLNAADSIGKRLEKARIKAAQAQASNDDNAQLLIDTVAKLEAKLVDAKQAYDEHPKG